VFYLPRYLLRVTLSVFIILASVQIAFEPAQNSWYSVSLGFLCLSLFIAIFLFSVVKRFTLYHKWKNYRWWVNYHIFVVFVLWVSALFHSAFEFDSNYFYAFTMASIIIFFSGIAGQYFFIKMPRTKSGLEETREEITRESENHALELLKIAVEDVTMFNFLDKMDAVIRQTAFIHHQNLFGLIYNDIKMSIVKRKVTRQIKTEKYDMQNIEEYRNLIFKRLTIELKASHMAVARVLLKRWTYFHFGAVYVYVLVIAFHVYSKFMTLHFSELVFWNWR